MSRFESLMVFARVADLGSFAAAARSLGMSPAMVGNHVRLLEGWFEAPLVIRTTRRQALTDLGQIVSDHAKSLAGQMAGLDALSGSKSALTGIIRVSTPVALGHHHIAPALLAIAELHPQLCVEMRASDIVEDMVSEGLDIAIRNGPILGNEASLMARVIGRQHLLLIASPSYMDRFGEPQSLDELMRHRTIRYSRHGRPRPWDFPVGDETVRIDPPTFFMADHVDTLLRAACDGLGIARLPDWLAHPAIRSGSVREILPHQTPLRTDIFLVRPATHVASRKVAMVADFLADAVARSLDVGR